MSATPPSLPRTTIWIWPTGLFPRRLLYYFRAKSITLSTLSSHNIHLVPVTLTPPSSLASQTGYEPRPDGASLPCMRIQDQDGTQTWVHESTAIIGWLEETFGTEDGYANIYGESVSQRARTNDILSLFADTNVWSIVALVHSDPSTTTWSGLSEDQMSASAAASAKRRCHFCLSRLESWVEGDVVGKETTSLSGPGSSVTLADIVLMAVIVYTEESYGRDWIEEHGVLRVWFERAKEEAWYVGKEALKKCEEGRWENVLGN